MNDLNWSADLSSALIKLNALLASKPPGVGIEVNVHPAVDEQRDPLPVRVSLTVTMKMGG